MPLTILTYIKELINTLTKLINLPRWIGPLLTIIAIAINQSLIEFGVWPVQVAWLYLPPAVAASMSRRAGLISAALVAAYSIWLDPADFQRSVIIPLSVMALAALIGWQTRALRAALAEARAGLEARRMVDSLNGNIIRITEARELILDILRNNNLDNETQLRLRSALHTMNNLALATQGWAELRDLKAQLDREGK